MSHKNFRPVSINNDENFYGEFHLNLLINKKYTDETAKRNGAENNP
ncbi:MAG: hypothetical protein JWM28_3171 [Chitinophagaceae bacterium]|nr:hypothetical protein [Chitinophagaceae bacterium]